MFLPPHGLNSTTTPLIWVYKQVKSKISVAAGKSIDITIKMSARGRTGLLREYVMIKSNDKRRPTLSLYLSGYSVTTKQLKELFKKYESVLK